MFIQKYSEIDLLRAKFHVKSNSIFRELVIVSQITEVVNVAADKHRYLNSCFHPVKESSLGFTRFLLKNWDGFQGPSHARKSHFKTEKRVQYFRTVS